MKRASSYSIAAAAVLSAFSAGCSGFGQPRENLPPVVPNQGMVIGKPEEKSAFSKAKDVVLAPAAGVTKLADSVASPFVGEATDSGAESSASDSLSLSKPVKPSPGLYVAIAQAAERSGNLAGAGEQYRRALNLDANHLDALLGLARLNDRQNNFEEANKFYAEAAKRHPQVAAAHNDRGLCLARQGKLEDSVACLAQAVTLQPDRALYRNNLATVLVHLGRPDAALKHLVSVQPKPIAHYNLGVLLAQQNQLQLAAEHFRTAAQLDPTLEPARQWAARLASAPAGATNQPASGVR
ncbi:MAG: tetratricopeptide repeat protein [Planctomycetia bacterium]|nr:tetratricopeptide repeat protein [Planctomycetia bacterium]